MITGNLLDWYNAIFWGPFLVGAILLAVSSLRIGGHHGSGHGAAHGHGLRVHAGGGMRHAPAPTSHAPAHHGGQAARGVSGSARNGRASGDSQTTLAADPRHYPWRGRGLVTAILGTGSAPALVVFELFLVCYGVIGMLANGMLLHPPSPAFLSIAASTGIAIGLGAVIARLSAGLLSKIIPSDETCIVTREGLFGLTGTVAYPISETGGRIHIFDEFGTLHDETCSVAAGQSPIGKGSTVRVVDIQADGKLVVEETI